MRDRPELVFAHWAIRALRDLRGERWRALVERIAALDETHPDALAFALMMARLNNCAACNASRYLERGGCARCAQMVLTTLNKESEDALLARFRAAQKEIARAQICSERKAA
jgi:flagellar motor switch protein FliG